MEEEIDCKEEEGGRIVLSAFSKYSLGESGVPSEETSWSEKSRRTQRKEGKSEGEEGEEDKEEEEEEGKEEDEALSSMFFDRLRTRERFWMAFSSMLPTEL